jgi:cobalt-zinc-cadmium efflux system membrane fusion protein
MNKIMLLPFIIFMISCKGEKTEVQDLKEDVNHDQIEFTAGQINMAEIVTGKLSKEDFFEKLTCSGSIEPTPRSLAQITVPYGGFIKSINYFIGDNVKKGDILAEIENPEFIKLQEVFLSTAAEVEYLKEDFKRQGELNLDNSASIKKFQEAKANYHIKEANLMSIGSQLKLLGINPEKIKESGIKSSFFLQSPISGNVSKIQGNIGKFVNNQEVIFEIVDPSHLHLHLRVFEKDVSKVKKGQLVKFNTLANPEISYEAKIISPGRSINEEDHTVTIHAELLHSDNYLIPGLYVNAEIITFSVNDYAIPKEGVVLGEDISYIYTVNNKRFNRIGVKINKENKHSYSILDFDQNIIDSLFVVKGAYFIQAALEARAEE